MNAEQKPADSSAFHKLAKDAGNRLGNYVMAYASAATGVFFFALVQDAATRFTALQKLTVLFALLLYVATVIIRLIELHVDARRFYAVAKELEKPETEQNWTANSDYKRMRLALIYGSYVTLALGTLFAVLFMAARVL